MYITDIYHGMYNGHSRLCFVCMVRRDESPVNYLYSYKLPLKVSHLVCSKKCSKAISLFDRTMSERDNLYILENIDRPLVYIKGKLFLCVCVCVNKLPLFKHVALI